MITLERRMSSSPATMRVARLHGVRDLRVESLPVPEPGPGELLVRIEGCGVCPTDVRKFLIGTGHDGYPLNPGHEWVGLVAAVGPGVSGWAPGDRTYGDTYAGYAEYATLTVEPRAWSHGPLRVDSAMPLERAIFVEPLADCVHAIRNQARAGSGDRVVVVGAGQMGLQLIAVAAAAGARVLAVEPLTGRQALAREYGAEDAIDADGWTDHARAWAGDAGATAVVLTLGRADAVDACLRALAPGGRLVLFAGFGDRHHADVDLNLVHYKELAIVGSEWVGTPPNSRLDCYEEAHALLASGRLRLERLVTRRCTLDTLEDAFTAVERHDALKIMLTAPDR
jgi:L-iditol 2-dehydrogenase